MFPAVANTARLIAKLFLPGYLASSGHLLVGAGMGSTQGLGSESRFQLVCTDPAGDL